jgi:hypothetical protein
MAISLNKIKEKLALGFAFLCLTWVTFALGFQMFFVYLDLSGQDERVLQYSNELSWKFDGTFKNDPNNIWYEGPKK